MRNTVISMISLIFIIAYSVFSLLFLDSFIDDTEDIIDYADKNGYSLSSVEKLENHFEDNKKFLIFISSKDYIDTIEDCIINIKYAVEYNDYQSIGINKDILIKTIDDMDSINKSPV